MTSCAHQESQSRKNEQAQYYLQIGSSYLEHNKLPEALDTFLKANKIKPNDPAVINSIGMAYLQLKKYKLAEKNFYTALSIKPAFTDVRNNLARLYIETKSYKRALRQLKLAKSDLTYGSPDTIQFLYGLLAFKTKKYRKAQLFLGKTHKKNPKHCETAFYLGQSLYFLKSYDCLLYTSPSPRDATLSRMPSSA